MANEITSMVQSSQTPEKIPLTSRVLLIDSDSTSLIASSRMLEHLGYTVTVATEGYQGLCTLITKEKEFDFILADSNFAGIGKYEFLDLAVQVSSVPVLLLSADNSKEEILGCLFKGSAFHILKPMDEKKAKTLWQFSFLKTSFEEDKRMQYGNGLFEHQTVIDTNDQKNQNFTWDPAFLDRYLEAVRTFGTDDAQPQKILNEVNAFCLLRHHAVMQLKRPVRVPPTDPEEFMNPDEMEINGPVAWWDYPEQLFPPLPEQENEDED